MYQQLLRLSMPQLPLCCLRPAEMLILQQHEVCALHRPPEHVILRGISCAETSRIGRDTRSLLLLLASPGSNLVCIVCISTPRSFAYSCCC